MRDKLQFGYSANDKNGSFLREGAEFIELALAELYTFLSANRSDVTLPIAVPKESGGTGASTDAEHQRYVHNYMARGAQAVMVKNIPVAVCMVGFGREPRTQKLTELSGEISFFKLGVGQYKINVFDPIIKVENDYVFVCPDNFGNRKIAATVRYSDSGIFINTYLLKFNKDTGQYFIDENSATVDVPENTYMSFILVNSLGNVI